jgi:hypothetical protein
MGVFSELNLQLNLIRAEFCDLGPTTEAEMMESQIAQRLNSLISELDELVAMAAHPETSALIENEKIAVGQIISRAQLIGSFLLANHPRPQLRTVRHS